MSIIYSYVAMSLVPLWLLSDDRSFDPSIAPVTLAKDPVSQSIRGRASDSNDR